MSVNTSTTVSSCIASLTTHSNSAVCSKIMTVGVSTDGSYRWEEPNEQKVEDLHWLTAQLPIDALPKRISPEICERCFDEKGKNFDEWYLNSHKKIKCPCADKPLLIWRDKAPKACPYITEQTVSDESQDCSR